MAARQPSLDLSIEVNLDVVILSGSKALVWAKCMHRSRQNACCIVSK